MSASVIDCLIRNQTLSYYVWTVPVQRSLTTDEKEKRLPQNSGEDDLE